MAVADSSGSREGCLAIEVEGVLAAPRHCCAMEDGWHGSAWLLTKMPYRGRGFARRLLNEALTLADHGD